MPKGNSDIKAKSGKNQIISYKVYKKKYFPKRYADEENRKIEGSLLKK
jgi:hypothetical protein